MAKGMIHSPGSCTAGRGHFVFVCFSVNPEALGSAEGRTPPWTPFVFAKAPSPVPEKQGLWPPRRFQTMPAGE